MYTEIVKHIGCFWCELSSTQRCTQLGMHWRVSEYLHEFLKYWLCNQDACWGYVAITVSLDSVHSQHVFSTLLPLCWLQINSLTPYLVLFQAVVFFWFSEKLFLGCSTFSSVEGTPFYICLWHLMYQLKYSWIKISPKILPLFIKCEWLSMNIVLPWMYTSKFRTKETTRHFFRRW